MHYQTSLQFSSPTNQFWTSHLDASFPILSFKSLKITWWRYDRAKKSFFTIKSTMILKMSTVFLLSSRKTLSREVLSFIGKLALVRTGSKGCQTLSSTHLLRIPKIKVSAQNKIFNVQLTSRNVTNQRWANFPYWHRQPRPYGLSLC